MSHLDVPLAEILGQPFVDSCEKLIKSDLIYRNDGLKPKDVCHTIPITLSQFCIDYTVTLKAAKRLPCNRCNGMGNLKQTCTLCNGERFVFDQKSRRQIGCRNCKGTGHIPQPCTLCKGKQAELKENVFEIKVPRGSFPGTKIRLAGQGDSLLAKPETSSDIVCTVIEQPHPVFKRIFNDLFMFKTISLRQAICGFKFSIKHVDGRSIALVCKPGEVTKPNSYKCAKNQGMPIAKSVKRGDLIVLFNVKFPTNLKPCFVPRLKEIMNDMKYKDTEVIAEESEESEEMKLTDFDPKEQVYNVPFRQSSAYSDKSPLKKNNTFNSIPDSCKQQ